jgi:AbrB family looped-hinge helix DNA binding protein
MSTATLTTKGQITIPAAVRASLGLETGSRVEFVEAANGQYLIVAATQPMQALKGLLRKPGSAVSIEAMNQMIALSAAGTQ